MSCPVVFMYSTGYFGVFAPVMATSRNAPQSTDRHPHTKRIAARYLSIELTWWDTVY